MQQHEDASLLSGYLDTAVEVARKAGDLIRADFSSRDNRRNLSWKQQVDPVTDTDKQTELLVFDLLRKRHPAHSLLGEESSSGVESVLPTSEYTWVVDPLDGTTNFIHGYPQVCVSVALLHRGRVVVGVVHDPVSGDLYSATRGGGAYLNGKRIRVSPSETLSEAIVGTNVGYWRDGVGVGLLLGNLQELLVEGKVLGVRMTGSAALAMASAACGTTCAFYERGIHIWDIAAGCLLVEEAGGAVAAYNGGPLDLSSRQVVAGSPGVVRALCEILEKRPF